MRKNGKPSSLFILCAPLLVLAAFAAGPGFAQTGFGSNGGITKTSSTKLTGTAISANATLANSLVISNLGPTATQDLPGHPASVSNVIRLTLAEESGKVIPQGLKATVNVTLLITNADQSQSTVSNNITVGYAHPTDKAYDAQNYISFKGAQAVTVTVNSITLSSTQLPDNSDTRVVLTLENEIDITYYYLLNSSAVPIFSSANPTTVSTDPTSGFMQDGVSIAWQWPTDQSTGNNYTQLEWTWLEDELLGAYANDGTYVTNTDLLFANNATRVDLAEVGADGYNIPLLYDGPGHLYYRIRAVNIQPGGSLSVGPWYTTSSQGTSSSPLPVQFDGHNNNLNWQVTTSFAEGGKRKSVVQYYDGSLRGRQTVTKDNSTQTAVTAETFYDKQGRAAIQILPTPGISGADNIIAYRQNLNLFNAQAGAAGTDPSDYFDLVPVNTPDLRLQTNAGSSKYYSSSNGDLAAGAADGTKNLPDAGGYPYAQTVYTPDGTGRIAAQGGVGPSFQIGSNHETKYFYGRPFQQELDGLFGTEAGNHSHYFKNMVLDANGQVSISYVDMHGRTVATALSGTAPTGLSGINNSTDYPGQQGSGLLTEHLLAGGDNEIKGDAIESVNTILVETGGTHYTFTYTLPSGSYQPQGCSSALSYAYHYSLEIAMVDEATGIPVRLNDNTVFDVTYNDITSEQTPSLTFVTAGLPPGSYSVRKTLSVRTDIMTSDLQDFLKPGTGICNSLEEAITLRYNFLQQTSGCAVTGAVPASNVCLELSKPAVGTQPSGQQMFITNFVNNYYASLGIDPAGLTDAQKSAVTADANTALAAELSQCQAAFSNPVSHRLEGIEASMLADMKPYSGQYAASPVAIPPSTTAGIISAVTGDVVQYVPNDAGSTMFQKYNIFTASVPVTNGSTATTGPEYQNPSNLETNLSGYTDVYGNLDAGVPNAALPALSPDVFTGKFNDTWEKSLLPYHPEYGKLHFARQNLAAVYDWIDAGMFAQTNTMADAKTNGFIDMGPVGIAANPYPNITGAYRDPFFSISDPAVAGSGGYKSKMNTYLTSNWQSSNGQNLTLWQVAYGSAVCVNQPNDAARQACFAAAPLYPPGYGSYPAGSTMAGDWNALVTNADQTLADKVWNNFKGLYQSVRDAMVNSYINTKSQQTDDNSLVAQGFILHFPETTDQAIQQTGVSSSSTQSAGIQWYTPQGTSVSATPPAAGTSAAETLQHNISVAHGYGQIWKNELLENSDIANSPDADAIVNAIIGTATAAGGTGFMGVCQNAVDAAHPQGATNDPAGAAAGDGSTSFEQVFRAVVTSHGLSLGINCNPYVIQYPKPYASSPRTAGQQTGQVNQCMCGQYASILSLAEAADPAINASGTVDFTELNTYLDNKYGETIAQPLFAALQNCGANGSNLPAMTIDNSGTVYRAYTLDAPQPLPQYLVCGFKGEPQCLNCAAINTWANSFVSIFPLSAVGGSYTTVPLVPADGNSLTDAEVNYNVLFANYLNYQTGLQFEWADYAASLNNTNHPCQIQICPAGSVGTNITVTGDGSDQPLNGYVAGGSIDIIPDFDFAVNNNSLDAFIDATATVCGNGTGGGGGNTALICPVLAGLTNSGTSIIQPQAPCRSQYDLAAAQVTLVYQNQLGLLAASFKAGYLNGALSNAHDNEVLDVQYSTVEYHYTLYYYDMAGNLVKTVPPKGVHPDFTNEGVIEADKQTGVANPMPHTFVTNYRYNSLNQVAAQNTPDAGTCQFWYDRLGRLVVSQNAQQYVDGKYSYTLYDPLGRIKEVGQKPQTTVMGQTISQDEDGLANWLTSNGSNTGVFNKEQITRTTYDGAYLPLSSDMQQADFAAYINQQNLRNRVSYSEVFGNDPDAGGTAVYHNSATYYTYDIHGNVGTLLQDYGNSASANPMNQNGNRFKTMAYNYDLISGKVNSVAYQDGYADAVYHRYSYDDENRLTVVETSRDNIYYEQDAGYSYYKHGPLMQTTLGKLGVQQLNYTYTLQGWLKSVNAGWDGSNAITPTGNVAAGAYGFSLHYYAGDYGSIYNGQAQDGIFNSIGAIEGTGQQNLRQLYNGNIAAMAVNIPSLAINNTGNTGKPMVYHYQFDQLNRLVGMDAFNNAGGTNIFASLNKLVEYHEAATYDPNGNIVAYVRNGNVLDNGMAPMDNLHYHYIANTNKLSSVTDEDGDTHTGMEDIGTQDANNYTYDAIGNLTANAKEHIGSITWTVYGKIGTITKPADGIGITYTYDVAGNRISKAVAKNGVTTTTWYVRDASGNVMSIYSAGGGTNAVNQGDLSQTEIPLYGSSRLGEIRSGAVAVDVQTGLAPVAFATIGYNISVFNTTFIRGLKVFELSNHLGNVLVTVSDKKLGHDAGNGTIDYYTADVVSSNDYYPGGMLEPGRQFTAAGGAGYRYGFNGQENSDEIGPNTTTAEYWEYDARIVRRWNVDPIGKEYESPYAAFSNNPIARVDILGNSDTTVTSAGGNNALKIDNSTNKLEFYGSSKYYVNGTQNQVAVAKGELRSYTNPLGTFSARWQVDQYGGVDFKGYLNSKGQTEGAVINEFLNSWSYKIYSWGRALSIAHDKDPLGYNLKLTTSLLMMGATSDPGGFGLASEGEIYNPSVVTQEDMSALGTLTFASRESNTEQLAILYRNFGWNELNSTREAAWSFSIHPNQFQGKQFWVGESGMQMWNNSSFAKPFTAEITVPKSFVTPGHVNYIFMEPDMMIDGFPGGTVLPQNLPRFNSDMKINWIQY